MVATNLKAETKSLIEKRDFMEIEMNSIITRLSQPGGPGITGNLLDSEGFPRSDIDVPAVRADRLRLSELRNDYKEITEKISESLQVLHSARLAPKPLVSGEGSNNQFAHLVNTVSSASAHDALTKDTHSSMDVDINLGVPFAIVDEIVDDSPAAEDGLQLGDQIVKFGNVESGEGLLQRLASEAQSNQGRAVPLVVLRQGVPTNLALTPRSWQGRGLLGCHFRIL
ncbi:hypothetical protein AQUCO_00300157v1 [Aquilegia coerulea]|uniref:PDZ domain-containing protein n=1 Tax=Aquilegia coerulea TaxID=218851 RepID=A0A2G5EXK2_AQUCA|nr:hypothetical protein AQUCO_00300157v1 [Aquilegia coerulea]